MTADPDDVSLVRRCPAVLAPFNAAGVLAPVDVHTATTLARLAERRGGEVDERALLAFALAVRAPRQGHAYLDLRTVADVVAAEEPPADLHAADAGDSGTVGIEELLWPRDVPAWAEALRATGIAPDVDDPRRDDAPLRVDGTRVYLDRHLRDERIVGDRVRARATAAAPSDGEARDGGARDEVLDELFGPASDGDLQRVACAASVQGRLTVVAGGPGTGKTYTVTRIVALHAELARRAGRPLPRVALVAPTGKAAARLEESISESLADLPVSEDVRAFLASLGASTIHRLLGQARGSSVRPRHDAREPLDVDLVVVDETSMVPLSLMARLLEALSERARLVLVGDPDQLESVEAGTVLGDVIGRPDSAGASPLGDRVVSLTRARRFGEGSAVARLADAIRTGDDDAVVGLLADASATDATWLSAGDPEADPGDLVRSVVVDAGRRVLTAARDGDADRAAHAAAELQVLCAHRRGPAGVRTWTQQIERWLAAVEPGLDLRDEWYAGRPVLLTRNDHVRELYNGDSGVVLRRPGSDPDEPTPVVAFAGSQGAREFAASRLGDLETAWAITIHKSQGSQYDHVVVLLPDERSRLLTRELLYTAVTRARRRVTIVGGEAALRAAVTRRVARLGGLRDALWGAAPGSDAERHR